MASFNRSPLSESRLVEQTSPFDSLFSALSSVPFSDTSSAAGSSSTWTGSGESRDTADKKTGTLQVVNSAAGTGEKLSGQVLSVYNSAVTEKRIRAVSPKKPAGDFRSRR